MRTGGKPVQPFGKLHVWLVGRKRKADVSKPVELMAYSVNY
jgi:hypothetical protein